MKNSLRRLLSVSFALSFFACSGGGGSDGSDGPKGSAETGVRVLHTAIDLTPVTVTSSAKVGQVILKTRFAEESGFSELPQGEQSIAVQSVDGANGPFTYSIDIKKRDRRDILVYGSRQTYGISATLLAGDRPEVEPGFAFIRVAHGAAGAASLRGSVGVTSIQPVVSFGEASDYIKVPVGDVQIRLARAVDSKLITNRVFPVENKVYTFVVGGELDYLVTGSLLED